MRKKFLYFISFIYLLSGCDNYLDVVPENDLLNIESAFEKSSTALCFLYSAYSKTNKTGRLQEDPSICGADEYCASVGTRNTMPPFRIGEGLNNPSTPVLPAVARFGNYYLDIRNANTFIANIDKVYNLNFYEKSLFKSYAYAIKGYYYFHLMRMYGPIVLVPENISVEASLEEMQLPRQPIDTVVNEIVRLFDKALTNIPSIHTQNTNLYGLLNKEAVLAYKAKALLYAASPLYNGNVDYVNFKNKKGEQLFSTEYDAKKWERAAKAVDEAIEFCEGQGLELVKGYDKESSEVKNTIRDIQESSLALNYQSSELIWGTISLTQMDITFRQPFRKTTSSGTTKSAPIINPSMRMVEMFYTENGLPLDMDPQWDYVNKYQNGIELRSEYSNVVAINKPVLKLHLQREPRFYANIAFDRGIWKAGSEYIEMDPYFEGENGLQELNPSVSSFYNLTGYWSKKGLHTSNVVGTDSPPNPYVKMRLAELYLMQAEAWNEVGIDHKEKVYEALNKVRERAGIPTVQESWANSYMPEKINSQQGLREIIRQEINIELAFEGHRFWNIRRWKIAHEVMNTPIKGWNVFGATNMQFYNNFDGPVVVWNKNSFESPRDYFWPHKDEEILKSEIVQNIGW